MEQYSRKKVKKRAKQGNARSKETKKYTGSRDDDSSSKNFECFSYGNSWKEQPRRQILD